MISLASRPSRGVPMYPNPAVSRVWACFKPRILLRPPIQLGNRGGLITLLDPAGLKADGVAYTQQQASAEGQTIVF